MQIYNHTFPDNLPAGWEATFIDAKKGIKTSCKQIDKRLAKTQPRTKEKISIVPDCADTFAAYRQLPPEKVKVVIIGQDPYYSLDKNLACGLAFSTGKKNIPPSLANVYQELKRNYPDIVIPKHGDLSAWCKEGVMLLNISLTTINGQPNAHKGLWLGLLESTIRTLSNLDKGIVWIMWGGQAQKIAPEIKRGIKFMCGHPSPMGANAAKPFKGCRHFYKVNVKMTEQGKRPIDWRLPATIGGELEVIEDKLETIEDSQSFLEVTIEDSD
jgi:uracil-DNA glycosylase